LIVLAALVYTEILSMYLLKKQELFGDGKDEEEEINILDINLNP
jgi:hypothetical protein